jgi:hypothetical protein
MLLVKRFKNDDSYYGSSAEERLQVFSVGLEREQIVSATRHEDGSITLFYWSE